MTRYQIYYQRTDGSKNGAYASTIYEDRVCADTTAYICNWADKGKIDYQVREASPKGTGA